MSNSKLIHRIVGSFSIAVLLMLLYACKTVCRDNTMPSSKNGSVVTKANKMSRNVYVIYALRNDTTFKIASFYNGIRQANSKKLRKGVHFQANLYSQFRSVEEQFNIIPPCDEVIEFHGVTIGKEPEHGIDDVWFCKELNGPYLIVEDGDHVVGSPDSKINVDIQPYQGQSFPEWKKEYGYLVNPDNNFIKRIRVSYKGIEYELGVSDNQTIQYIATSDKHFSTNGYKVGDVINKTHSRLGWGNYTKIDQEWYAAWFPENRNEEKGSIQWFFKFKF